MKQTRMLVLMGTMVAFCAMGKADLTGTAEELVAHLREIPGQVTLMAAGELEAEADRADVVIKVRSSDRSFKTALAQNQQTRLEIMATLEKNGIPAERIRLSKFSSTPTQGVFSSKVKSYEIESRVTIEATSEQDIQAVAGVIDEKEGLSVISRTFRDTLKDAHTTQALTKALAKLKDLKGIYEKELGVMLVPRSVGPKPGSVVIEPPMPRKGFSDASGIASAGEESKSIVTMHALEEKGPDISQFDQVFYRAEISVTYDVIRQDK